METLLHPFTLIAIFSCIALLLIFSPFEIDFEDGEDIEW